MAEGKRRKTRVSPVPLLVPFKAGRHWKKQSSL